MVGSSSVTDGVCVGRPLSTFAGVVPVVGSSCVVGSGLNSSSASM